jgi:hypothetical protein
MDNLTSTNFLIYAARHYDRVNCVMSEFEHDLKRIKYLKRLIRKYKITGIIKERLVLNHIIILNNVFGPEAVVRMLFFKVDIEDYDVLKTFLLFLNLMPIMVKKINGANIISSEIAVDMTIANLLRKI